ncbi:hypothetical protein A8L34_16775 [Bacillus sp. FJAT-27264]|nr:hypothetical protein A8L34_16775 [Bacillus sp. FJAT-27264]
MVADLFFEQADRHADKQADSSYHFNACDERHKRPVCCWHFSEAGGPRLRHILFMATMALILNDETFKRQHGANVTKI